MSKKINNLMVVLAGVSLGGDERSQLLPRLCRSFLDTVESSQIEVDFLDLDNDNEFHPTENSPAQDTKAVEYQLRFKKADMIVIFHSTPWQSLPAVLKGFVDKVFSPGFAYRIYRKIPRSLINDKKALVVAVSDVPAWKMRFMYGNIIYNFWQKAVFGFCDIACEIILLDNLRVVRDEAVIKWQDQIVTKAQKLIDSR